VSEQKVKTWLEQFNENYNEKSDQARELKDFVKKAVKGNSFYVPWATMERMIYQQDPKAELETLYDSDGTAVFTKKTTLYTHQSNNKDDSMSSASTEADFFVHMVRVRVTFLGKSVVEDYPIQDATQKGQGYTAPKVIDANLVNNAIKRALTKACSRVSGLALKLYESLDLQFESDDEPKTTPIVNPIVNPIVETTPKAPESKVVVIGDKLTEVTGASPKELTTSEAQDLVAIAEQIVGNETILTGIQKANTSIAKKYGFTLDIKDDVATTASKLAKVKDPATLLNSIKSLSGLK